MVTAVPTAELEELGAEEPYLEEHLAQGGPEQAGVGSQSWETG